MTESTPTLWNMNSRLSAQLTRDEQTDAPETFRYGQWASRLPSQTRILKNIASNKGYSCRYEDFPNKVYVLAIFL